MHDLEQYIEGLHKGRSRYYSRGDSSPCSATIKICWAAASTTSSKTRSRRQAGVLVESDDYFYFSRGIALGMAEMLDAVNKEFHQELQKKGSASSGTCS